MSLKLLRPGDLDWPRLFQPAAPVVDIPTQVSPHLPDLRHLLRRGHGVGLAAPQAGVFYRFFLYGGPDLAVTCVNPRVLYHGPDQEDGEEGCLSYPGFRARVRRWTHLEVAYTTLGGQELKKSLSGLTARVFQHELDHLAGVNIFSKDDSALATLNTTTYVKIAQA